MTHAARPVVVAMSGGVDSSVAAALLKDSGRDVIGITLRLPTYGDEDAAYGDEDAADAPCCGVAGIEDARRVAEKLDIPFYTWDFRQAFRETVIDDFCRAYAAGRTPNPCIRCNDWVKFGLMLHRAQGLGAGSVATGHYVRKETANGRIGLSTGRGSDDQSYFLYCLTQEQLRRAEFPVGDIEKDEVRRLAREHDLPVHDKPGSQDLCFLPAGRYREFLRTECPEAFRPGPIVHVSGQELGMHEGIAGYTVGQRRGLGIAHGRPLYVVAIRAADNVVMVGEKEHILRRTVAVSEVNWIAERPDRPVRAQVKIRYNHPGADADVASLPNGAARVEFDEPQEAPCPGQAAVFYDGDRVLGGGTIETANEDTEAP